MALALGAAVSCEGFFNEEPVYAPSADNFFTSENALKVYANQLIDACSVPAATITQSGLVTDLTITHQGEGYLKIGGYSARQATNWAVGNWSDLYKINYFIDHIKDARKTVSESVCNHYEGVGRMWRAWFYWDKVKMFGDVPFYEHVVQPNDTTLMYKGRDSREYVMGKVLEDLNYAVANCSISSSYVNNGYVNRYVALALKARICLFEGTWLKYHGYSGWEKWLQECISASEAIMNSGKYSLLNTGNPETDYSSVFKSEDTQYTEVIFSNAFSAEFQRYHGATQYWWPGNAGSRTSASRAFIYMFLNRDGSRFTDKEEYWKTQFKDEFIGRDYRLKQIIVNPDYSKKLTNGTTTKDWSKLLPNLNTQLTWYRIHKWSMDDEKLETTSLSTNDLPIFRYGEVLLDYAEAKAELSQMGDAEWSKSIALLRQRAGVNPAPPQDADPYLVSYYGSEVTDKWILEIRRERAIELFVENTSRWDDLMRWKKADLLNYDTNDSYASSRLFKMYEGIYIPEVGKPFDMNGDGANDLCIYSDKKPTEVKGVTYVKIDGTGEQRINSRGCVEFGMQSVWLDYKYLHPVPKTAIDINKNLLPQNPGWDD